VLGRADRAQRGGREPSQNGRGQVRSMIYLTQLIYLREGHEATFDRFEDAVLRLLSKHRGELLLRLRPDQASKIDGSSEAPYEIHVVRFESDDDLLRYSNDEERKRLLPLKEQSVRSSLLIKGALT
jgi:uncharacterized protein (DUF1330 family)